MSTPADHGDARDAFPRWFAAIGDNLARVFAGKREVIENAVVTALARGHLIIDDVPGVGKTTLAAALAASTDMDLHRVQSTPDLLPSDIVGTPVWNQTDGSFTFRPGPIFTNLLLVDEINRASPKTQSALLEAMAERQVTVDGVTRRLPDPFMVIATQNPLEHHGTFPLPDSQLDRFTMSLSLGYPERTAEDRVLRTDGADRLLAELTPVISGAQFIALADHCDRIHVSDDIRAYLLDLAEATRNHPSLRLGMSTRSLISVQATSRVRAAAEGRDHVLPEDVRRVILPVVTHRLLLATDHYATAAETRQVLESIVASTPLRASTA
jgi:MoxR-like ATPase